jgi:predicted aspartyl protease
MMNSSVYNGHVLLPVILRLLGQPDFALDFVVDTGGYRLAGWGADGRTLH